MPTSHGWGKGGGKHIPIHLYYRVSVALTGNRSRTRRAERNGGHSNLGLIDDSSMMVLTFAPLPHGKHVWRVTYMTGHWQILESAAENCFFVLWTAQRSDRQKKTSCKGERSKRQIMLPVWGGDRIVTTVVNAYVNALFWACDFTDERQDGGSLSD
jgi:hypothetical protein